MQIRLGKALAVVWGFGLASGLAQGFSGAGYGNRGPAGGSYGAVTVARVNVAPVAGASWGVGGSAAGGGNLAGPVAGGGGLFGVTRPTPMAEANVVAAQFFTGAGVPLATPGAVVPAAAPRAVPYWGGRTSPRSAGNPVALAALPPSSPSSGDVLQVQPAETPPFAPPVQSPAVQRTAVQPDPAVRVPEPSRSARERR